MAPPPPMKCQVQDCVYSTAVNLTTFDHQFRDLEFHLRMAHPQLAAQTAAPAPATNNPGGGGPKPDKLPRPAISEGITQTDWVWFDDVESFEFKRPGADHHARWMSKAIYYLKLYLLMDQFIMEEKSMEEVKTIAQFVALFYAKAFFKCPLPCSAASTDLGFMSDIHQWRNFQPKVSFKCLQSCYRHLWYITPQLVVLSLLDRDTSPTDKEDLARKLFSVERVDSIKPGKPVFPYIPWTMNSSPPKLSSFISKDSWLIFDLLGLKDPQEWLQTPPSIWDKFKDYRKFRDFGLNLTVVNDLAERGIHLATDFIDRCRDEKQRQALLQVVEDHRIKFPDYKKDTLAKTKNVSYVIW